MKRHLSLVVSVLVLVAMVLSISACSVPDAGKKHEHTHSADWSYDATNHWHAANCADNDECKSATADVAAHTLEGNTCSVCGYVKPADPQPEDPKPEDPKPETPVADGTAANPFALTVPGSLEIAFAGGYDPIWYAFTATETKTLSITLSSNNAVVGYGVAADSITYSNGETVVEFSVEADVKYFVNFSTLDAAAAEYTVATEYIVKASPYETVLYAGNNSLVFSEAEVTADAASRKLVIEVAGDYKFASGNLFVASIVDADGEAVAKNADYTYTLVAGEYTVNFGMLSMFGVVADETCGLNVENQSVVDDGEDDDEEEVVTGPLDTENSTLVVGANTITVTAEDIEAQCIVHTIVVTAEGTFVFTSDSLLAQIVTNYGPQQGEVYLLPGTYTVNVVTAYVSEAGDYTLNLAYTAPASGDLEGTEEDPIEITLPAEDLAVEGDSINFTWYTFTTTDAGMITITFSSANTWVSLKNVADAEDSQSGYEKDVMVFNVQANSTYVLGLGVWGPEEGVTATVAFGEGSVEPDGSMDYPFEVDGYPYNEDITLGESGIVYYTFVAPANGSVTVEVSGENVDAISILGIAYNEFTSIVLAGEEYYFYILNEGEAEVSFSMSVTFEEAELTAEDYKAYMVGRYAYDADWYWCIVFDVTDDGVYYAKVMDGDWVSCYYYDFDMVVNADGSYTIVLNSILDLTEVIEPNTGDEYVMANGLNVILTYGDNGYVLNFEVTPVDESELSGTGAKNDPYVIPGSGVYAFADVNDYPGKAISFTADKALTLKLSADVAELYTLSFSSKLAGDGEVYEITLAEGETFSCFVCMFSGTADVKLTVEVADVESGDNEEDDEEDVEGTEYYGTDAFGSSLTLIVGDSTVTFIYSSQMMGESEATFVYLLVDGAFVLYADGEEVNPLAANITVDENGVPVSAVYNGYNFILSTEKPGEGEEEEQTNNLVVGENELVVVDTQMGDTYNLPVNADATVTYTITAGANTVFIVNNTDVYFPGNSVDVTVPAGETVSIVVGPYYNEDPTVIVVVAVKDAEAEEQKTVLHVGSNSVTVESSGGSIVYLPVSENNVVYTVTVGRDTIIDYNDGWYDTQGATFEVTVPAGEYVGIRAMAGDSANPRVTISVAIKETSAPEEEPDPHAGLAGNGTSSNPYVLVELPFTVTFPSAHDVYYVYTATEACVITIVCPAGCLVSETGATKNDEGNYVITLEAGATLRINPWDMGGTAPYTYTISSAPVENVEEDGGDDEGDEAIGTTVTYLGVGTNSRGMKVEINTTADTLVITRAQSGTLDDFVGVTPYNLVYSEILAMADADGKVGMIANTNISGLTFDENGVVTSIVWTGVTYSNFVQQ